MDAGKEPDTWKWKPVQHYRLPFEQRRHVSRSEVDSAGVDSSGIEECGNDAEAIKSGWRFTTGTKASVIA